MKKEQAVPAYRTDVPSRLNRAQRRKRDFKVDMIYSRTGILDMTRRKNNKRFGSQVERIVMRL